MLVSLALGIALNIAAAVAHSGWVTAALVDVLVGGFLVAVALHRPWRPLLVRLVVFGAVAGAIELATDAAGERFAHSLIYPSGAPMLWASPIYMPLSWAIVLTQLGYLAWRLGTLMPLPAATALVAAWAGANIPFYEEMAFHARWWRYAPAFALGHTPVYVILFEALIGASLPVLVRGLDRRRWPAVPVLGAAEGAWMPVAALAAWLLMGR